jgi:hypothetical protein
MFVHENTSSRRKMYPSARHLLRIPHGVVWVRTQATEMGDLRLGNDNRNYQYHCFLGRDTL